MEFAATARDNFARLSGLSDTNDAAYQDVCRSSEEILDQITDLGSDRNIEFRELIADCQDRYSTWASPDRPSHYFAAYRAFAALKDRALWKGTKERFVPTPELIDLLGSEVRKIGESSGSPYVPLLQGITEFLCGDVNCAFDRFAQAGSSEGFRHIIRDSFRGASTCKQLPPLHLLTSDTQGAPGGDLTWLLQQEMIENKPCFSFFGDDVYFRAFSLNILETLIDNSRSPQNLHFHIINYSQNDSALMIQMLSDLSAANNVRLRISSEKIDQPQRTYFATARFFKAHDLLRALDRPIIIMDLDVVFSSDIDNFIGSFHADSVNQVFSRGPYWGFLPWRSVWAGLTYIPNNQVGALFAKTLRGCSSYLWGQRDDLSWWVDQNALFLCDHVLRHYGFGSWLVSYDSAKMAIRSSENLKIEGLKRLEGIGLAMSEGRSWHDALRTEQFGES